MLSLYRYRDLVGALVARELKVRYRRSAIGFLWTMLQPLLTMLVLQLVFSAIFVIKLDYGNYPVYALAGVLFWNFFSQSIVSSMNSLRGNAQLLQKLPVPKAVFPLATVISGVVNLLFALVPLLAMLLVTGHPITPALPSCRSRCSSPRCSPSAPASCCRRSPSSSATWWSSSACC